MNSFRRFMLFNDIYLKYANEMWIHVGDCGKEKRAFSYVSNKEVIMPEGVFMNPTEWDILSLLHEIGHIKTNKDSMRVFEKEYLATQWCADEAKRWGFTVKDEWKDVYQKYIWDHRDSCVKRKGKNVPDKSKLVVKW